MNKVADLYQKETPTQNFLVNIAKFSETLVCIQNTSRLLSLKTTTELNCHRLAERGEYIKRYGERFPLDAFGNDQEDFICLRVKARTFQLLKVKWMATTQAVPLDGIHLVAVRGLIHQEVPTRMRQ